jgi:D-threo-aldose 1-dehydrogenase
MSAPEPASRRTIRDTGVAVSALGVGTAGIGGMYTAVTEDQAAATIRHALASGLSYLDTAPHYAQGLVEERVGRALAGVDRDGYVLSTKVGRVLVEAERPPDTIFASVPARQTRWDFTADGVRRSLDASLARLGLARVDVVYLHDPDHHVEQALGEAYPALEKLRAEGVVRAIGVGMNQSAVPTRFVTETDIDVVLLAGRWTLLDQTGLADLLPAAAERGRAVVIGGVFNSGLLANPRPGAPFDYAPAPDEVVARAVALRAVCERHGVPLTTAALQFPYAHPAVVSVLSGARSVAETEANLAALATPVPAALWAELAAEGLIPEGWNCEREE